jgi:hypothetical protein
MDSDGGALVDIEDPTWIIRGEGSDTPPLKFPTPEAALVACLRAEEVASARAGRLAAALRRLGRPGGSDGDPGPPGAR